MPVSLKSHDRVAFEGGGNVLLSYSGVNGQKKPLKLYRRLDNLFPTPADYCVCRSCEPDETTVYTPPPTGSRQNASNISSTG
jgi:hypothetical protein